jgi:hypothetical protein
MLTNFLGQVIDDQSTGKGDTETQEQLRQRNATHLSLEPQPVIVNCQQHAEVCQWPEYYNVQKS